MVIFYDCKPSGFDFNHNITYIISTFSQILAALRLIKHQDFSVRPCVCACAAVYGMFGGWGGVVLL